jgi:hypothetical protein
MNAGELLAQFDETARQLSALLDKLVAGAGLSEVLAVLGPKQIDVDSIVLGRLGIYGEFKSRELGECYTTLMYGLFARRGRGVTARAYAAADQIVAEQMAPIADGGPWTSLLLVHVLAAAHNLLWWRGPGGRRWLVEAAEIKPLDQLKKVNPLEAFKKELSRTFAPHLDVIRKLDAELPDATDASDSDEPQPAQGSGKVFPGDFLVLDKIFMTLERLLKPKPQARVSLTVDYYETSTEKGHNVRKITESQGPDEQDQFLCTLLDSMIELSPCARLRRCIQGAAVPSGNWPFLGVFLAAPALQSVRLTLASSMGGRIVNPNASDETVLALLRCLQSLGVEVERRCRYAAERSGWRTFVTDVLRSAVVGLSPEEQMHFWKRWSLGFEGVRPLAHWAGWLAAQAESHAAATTRSGIQEWAWRWKDLARSTLRPWTLGHEHAVFCLGLWLDGYLGCPDHIRSLGLARSVVDRDLADLVSFWDSAVTMETDGMESAVDPEALVVALKKLTALLDQNSAMADLRRLTLITRVPAAEAAAAAVDAILPAESLAEMTVYEPRN